MVKDMGTLQNFATGALEHTGNPFHIGLKDSDTFFVIQTEQGEVYSRAGSFERNAEGKLTTMNGKAVQGKNGEITFSNDETQVTNTFT
jgi:flagellar basal-body rod protein FlgF